MDISDTGALVYVVDDDPSAREGVARLIRSAGLMTKTFASGEEFLAAQRPKIPSCVVLDVDLPGVNGLDVQLELEKSGSQVPIVFLTGHGDVPMAVRAVRAGAANFLTKPVDDQDLLNAITQSIAYYLAAAQVVTPADSTVLIQGKAHQIPREFRVQLEARREERTRIARELHDTLLQSFNGLLMRFQAAQNMLPGRAADARLVLEGAIEDAAQAVTEARDAIQDLRSPAALLNDLAAALDVLGKQLAGQQLSGNGNAAAFSLVVEGGPRDLHPILRDEIYRIASEALRNAFHHARARQVEIEILYDARQLRVRVRDDGIGIDSSVLQEGQPGHWGLRGMRERTKLIGGHLEVWSKHGVGTEVELTIPATVAMLVPPPRCSSFSPHLLLFKE